MVDQIIQEIEQFYEILMDEKNLLDQNKLSRLF